MLCSPAWCTIKKLSGIENQIGVYGIEGKAKSGLGKNGPTCARRLAEANIMKGIGFLVLAVLGVLLQISGCDYSTEEKVSTQSVGWAIGSRSDETAAILHTANGGKTWEEQGNPALWNGMAGNDISAANEWTAWAAVGSPDVGGAILHTEDGGFTWKVQTLPDGVYEMVKGIKGISWREAWAVTIGGTVMHTTDAGENWEVVPHPEVNINQVNRIDVLGNDIWIADFGSAEGAMVHSADSGLTWRLEPLPDIDLVQGGPMGVSIVSSRIAWSAVKTNANLYRTVDGGDTWSMDAPAVSGPNDIDDICASNADTVWAAQNIGGFSGGRIIRVYLSDGKFVSDTTDPMNGNYQYEGVTCFGGKTAWVVGFKSLRADPGLPEGVILHTKNGGAKWVNQALPVSDISLWKVSFVDAHR